MYYPEGRDKLISLRVSSTLLEKVKKTIEERTSVTEFYGHKQYRYYGVTLSHNKPGYYHQKLSISDLFQEALEEFLEKNNVSLY